MKAGGLLPDGFEDLDCLAVDEDIEDFSVGLCLVNFGDVGLIRNHGGGVLHKAG